MMKHNELIPASGRRWQQAWWSYLLCGMFAHKNLAQLFALRSDDAPGLT